MIKDVSFEITKRCLNNCLHCSSCSTSMLSLVEVAIFVNLVVKN